MKHQRGIADGWLLLIVLAGAAVGLWYAYQTIDSRGYARGKAEVQAQFDTFKNETAEMGRKAQAAVDKRAADDQARKEKADVENKDLRRELDVRRKQLRDKRARPGGSLVPAPRAGAPSAEAITFSRSKLDRALREFETGVEALVGEGAEAVVDLNTAKKWAQP